MTDLVTNISNAQYVQSDGVNTIVHATIDGVEMLVPVDSANRHYQEIMKQVEAGELTIQAADEE